jgi:hypothetical protein
MFPKARLKEVQLKQERKNIIGNLSFQRPVLPSSDHTPQVVLLDEEDYGDSDIFNDIDFDHIDDFKPSSRKNTGTLPNEPKTSAPTLPKHEPAEMAVEPVQLPSGNWQCRHKCTDKTK